MKSHLKAASWFVVFESVFWFFGTDYYDVIKACILNEGFQVANMTTVKIIWFAISPFAIVFSLFALSQFVRYMMQGVKEATREVQNENSN